MGSQSYGRPLSTVFVDSSGQAYDEDRDPTIESLQFLDYRYLRFFYHPVEDKFSLINGWKDPAWTNAKAMRGGLDADERDSREQIFGQNVIDIQQKTVPQLLLDEVCLLLFTRLTPLSLSYYRNRLFTPSTSFKWRVSSFGLWMNITTMRFASFSSPPSALPPQW